LFLAVDKAGTRWRFHRGAKKVQVSGFRRPANSQRQPEPDVLQRRLLLETPLQEATMHQEKGRTVETAVEARAGFRDRPVLVVLTVSLVLAAVVFGLLWLGFAWHTPPGA